MPGNLPAPAGSSGTSTNADVARGILANLGNYAPTQGQLTAVEAWIQAEGTLFNPGSEFQNNPLDVTLGNVTASGIPSSWYTIPDPAQNNGNPVVSFHSLEGGITATAKGIQQPFAAAVNKLLSTPQDITPAALSAAVSSIRWGTAPFGGITNPTPTSGGGSTIGGTLNGAPASGLGTVAQGTDCKAPTDWKDVGGGIGYAFCLFGQQLHKDLPRLAAYVVGIVLVLVGVAIILVDDIKLQTPVGKVSLKQASEKVAA